MSSEARLRKLSVASAFFLAAALGAVFGWALEKYHFWPYELIDSVHAAARSVRNYGEIIPEGRRIAAPAHASRERFTIHNPGLLNGGYYVFAGWDDARSRYSAWLLDGNGRELHDWSLEYAALDPGYLGADDDTPHGFDVLADGSVIVNFDHGRVMARLDACSKPVWTKRGTYHHLLTPAGDGTYWVWRGNGTAYGHYQYLENFDARTGKTVRKWGLVEDIIQPVAASAIVFGVRPDFEFRGFAEGTPEKAAQDIFHPNDVEALPARLAPQFPMFEPGDLLISVRRLDLVAVLDADDGRVKWWSRGPWLSQHDADFTEDGKISVYNNNTDRKRSEILKIDPSTRVIWNELYSGDAIFHSPYMGVHQYLPNGNVLIVVPGEGRIIEVSSTGDNVMEFNNLAPDAARYNDHVENGIWIPADFFEELPNCPSEAK